MAVFCFSTLEESRQQILYQTCYHAQKFPKILAATDEQDHEINHIAGSTFPWISIRGLKQLRIGWFAPREPIIVNKGRSLVVSASGEYIAILFHDQVTILSKDDDFKEAFGTFTGSTETKVFLHGVWVDHWNVLAVSDNLDTIYFLKPNGDELKRIPKSHLKATGTIAGLFVQEDKSAELPDRYNFMVLTSDCMLHRIAITQDAITVVPLRNRSMIQSKLRKQHPFDISCLCFHSELSVLVLVGPYKTNVMGQRSAGLYSVSVWHFVHTTDLELICFKAGLEGLFSFPKSHLGPFCAPKVAISSDAEHLAVLDLTGNLHIFTLEGSSLSVCAVALNDNSPVENSDGGRPTISKSPDDIIDFTWRSEKSLIIAKGNGIVKIVEVPSARSLVENVPMFSSPVLGRNQRSKGHVYVLDCVFPTTESSELVQQASSKDVQDNMKTSYSAQFEIKNKCLGWQLLSMYERSVPEMYKILIDGQRYETALQFAVQHGLDKDEVCKLQWLHSDYGKEAIQNYLSNIQDRRWVLLECMDKVGLTVDSAHAILSYGLVETDQYRFQEAENADCSLVWWFRTKRLRLLQYKDRLETFLGVNMGRFSSQEYAAFRRAPLNEVAINLAESGKIGALNLLFKRHAYSLAPFILSILAAVPETIPVHSYSQLLPGLSPPKTAVPARDEDWVENREMLVFMESVLEEEDDEIDFRISTEHMVRLHCGFVWPPALEVTEWYRERARTIDKLSGQLENCLSLVDFGYHKGVMELQPLFEDISDLCHVVFSGYAGDSDIDTSLTAWEHLCDYDKFKIMLNGVNEATVVERLKEQAVPFMHRKYGTKDILGRGDTVNYQPVSLLDSVENSETFLVKWLKEIAEANQLEVCAVVIEEGCKDSQVNWLFKDETETMEVALYCIYTCTRMDKWGLMSSLLSSLSRKCLRDKDSFTGLEDSSPRQGFRRGLGRVLSNSSTSRSSNSKLAMNPMFLDDEESYDSSMGGVNDISHNQEKGSGILENLEKRLKLAEGHVEAGRLLAQYQVAKPIQFFLEAHANEKGVKQLLRLLLSKFGRRQPGRSDSDWAIMWRDMQCFQEKAFPFLDTEYMLLEFCRGLLKAGKFSLARNYLKGTASTALALEKAEILVIQAAREYFYSASSLDSFEIWKAKECLDLFPNSKQVKAEADLIDAITVKLPRLGVNLLPMQFRQIRDPMEIVKMAITSQTGAYLKVKELIEVSRLLGLSSPDDVAIVEAAIAREAGATGDLQLAVDLCLLLARKDHGPVWDLCAALGRGPDLDKMDLQSRKELLGFALSHCDEESVGDLLQAWKELDLASQCENLGTAIGKRVPTLYDQEALAASFPIKNIEEIVNLIESSQIGPAETLCAGQDEEAVFKILEDAISSVTKKFSCKNVFDWDTLLKENKRFMAFASLQLPWLLELNRTSLYDTNRMLDIGLPKFAKECSSVSARAAAAILHWLASNNIIPRDDLIVSVAKSAMEKPVTQEDDIIGCSYLLNLSDPHVGMKVIEEELTMREEYQEVHSAMKIGLIYSSLQGSASEYETPKQRRDLLLNKFRESQPSTDSGRHVTQTVCINEHSLSQREGWNAFQCSGTENQVGQGSESDVHRFTSILVALKSTELISGFWPSVEVTGEDLATIESAISFFCALASTAVSQPHILALGALLKQWEVLFQADNQSSENKETEDTAKSADPQDDWNEENGWADGWETFQYPKEEIDNRMRRVASIHTFHECWMIILEKLIEQWQLDDVVQLLDETCSNKNTVLLTEEEAQKLIGILSKMQPVLALKSALLLPYDSLWFQTLKMVDDKLKHGSASYIEGEESNAAEGLYDRNKTDGSVDYGLLALILSVGLVPSLAGDPTFSTVFSHCCASLGQLAYLLQESHLCLVRKEDQHCISHMHDSASVLFSSVAFPYFIAELTRGKHYFLAGALVLQFMHTHTSLSTINAAYVALKKYLERNIQAEQGKHQYAVGVMAFPHCLKNTIDGLRDKLGSVLKLALSILCEDLK